MKAENEGQGKAKKNFKIFVGSEILQNRRGAGKTTLSAAATYTSTFIPLLIKQDHIKYAYTYRKAWMNLKRTAAALTQAFSTDSILKTPPPQCRHPLFEQ